MQRQQPHLQHSPVPLPQCSPDLKTALSNFGTLLHECCQIDVHCSVYAIWSHVQVKESASVSRHAFPRLFLCSVCCLRPALQCFGSSSNVPKFRIQSLMVQCIPFCKSPLYLVTFAWLLRDIHTVPFGLSSVNPIFRMSAPNPDVMTSQQSTSRSLSTA